MKTICGERQSFRQEYGLKVDFTNLYFFAIRAEAAPDIFRIEGHQFLVAMIGHKQADFFECLPDACHPGADGFSRRRHIVHDGLRLLRIHASAEALYIRRIIFLIETASGEHIGAGHEFAVHVP